MGEDLIHGSNAPDINSDADMSWPENDRDGEDTEQRPASSETDPERADASGPADASGGGMTREDVDSEAAVTHGEIILVSREDDGAPEE